MARLPQIGQRIEERALHPFYRAIFDWAYYPLVRAASFHQVLWNAPQAPEAQKVLLVSNHTSWWDGFLARDVLNQLYPEHQKLCWVYSKSVEQHLMLRALGALPVDPTRPSTLIQCVRKLREFERQKKPFCLIVFPQGKIWPSHKRPLGFQKGVEWLLQHLSFDQVLAMGIHIEPLQSRKPTAWLRVAPSALKEEFNESTAEQLEQAVSEQLSTIQTHLSERGENATEPSWGWQMI
jgi:1-acyl-sn-glycerol-3-phosphate acyltransferase